MPDNHFLRGKALRELSINRLSTLLQWSLPFSKLLLIRKAPKQKQGNGSLVIYYMVTGGLCTHYPAEAYNAGAYTRRKVWYLKQNGVEIYASKHSKSRLGGGKIAKLEWEPKVDCVEFDISCQLHWSYLHTQYLF